MQRITRAQRVALKRVYDRCPVYHHGPDILRSAKWFYSQKPLTYRQFRKRVHPGYSCVMIQWCGMWLGIETDGYTHS